MAIYSDLLFSVSGDPIDVRASIYKIFKTKKNFLQHFLPLRKNLKRKKKSNCFPKYSFFLLKTKFIYNFHLRIWLLKDLITDNIRLRARVSVLEDTVAALEAKLAEVTATTGLWQYLLAGMGTALVLELLARPVWVRCTGRQFPLDRVLDRVVSPVVEKALAASHLAWARLLAATL
jgi:hypothetical protein